MRNKELTNENERLSAEIERRDRESREQIEQVKKMIDDFNTAIDQLNAIRERYEIAERDAYALKKAYLTEIEKELKRIKHEK